MLLELTDKVHQIGVNDQAYIILEELRSNCDSGEGTYSEVVLSQFDLIQDLIAENDRLRRRNELLEKFE